MNFVHYKILLLSIPRFTIPRIPFIVLPQPKYILIFPLKRLQNLSFPIKKK